MVRGGAGAAPDHPHRKAGALLAAPTTNGRYSQDPDRDWMLRALRGETTTEAAYAIVRNTRWLWHNQKLLNDPEAVAALNVGDNKHLDDAKRFEPLDETWLQPEVEYDPATTVAFEELAAREDFAAGYQPDPEPEPPHEWEDLEDEDRYKAMFIDWPTFFKRDRPDNEWALDRVLARGRGHSLWAVGKTGKSEILLTLLLAEIVTNPHCTDVVIYLDYEMSEDDLHQRITDDLGYSAETNLDRIHYAQIPRLAPLDTIDGANELDHMLRWTAGQHPGQHLIVVVDTIARAVAGEENSNDTIRNFYRHSGAVLRRHEATWARLDHGGHNGDHARGGSAKRDDVDIVWKLERTDNGARLRRQAARMSWVPETVTFRRDTDPLRYVRQEGDWPSGTAELTAELERLGVPVDVGRPTAAHALKEAQVPYRTDVLRAAIRYRKSLTQNVWISDISTQLGQDNGSAQQ